MDLAVASLEDVLISKLEWSSLGDSALQRHDVVQLLERTWPHLDHAYVNEWIARLGLDAEWRNARARAGVWPIQGDAE